MVISMRRTILKKVATKVVLKPHTTSDPFTRGCFLCKFRLLSIFLLVVAAVTMVTGKLVFGFVLGSVASTMANAEALRVKFEERFAAVQHHMKEQKMPLNLQARVVNFFEYIWRRNQYVFLYVNLSFWITDPSQKK